jgi:hypothetical protein
MLEIFDVLVRDDSGIVHGRLKAEVTAERTVHDDLRRSAVGDDQAIANRTSKAVDGVKKRPRVVQR